MGEPLLVGIGIMKLVFNILSMLVLTNRALFLLQDSEEPKEAASKV